MLRLEQIPPEQMPEVVRVASELYEKDREHEAEAEQRQATVDAAAEVGLPEEYLHRAAAELHARRVVEVQQKRRKRNGILAIGGAILVLGTTGYFIANPPMTAPPGTNQTTVARTPLSSTFNSSHWDLNKNSGTQAEVSFNNNTAVIHVQQFMPDTQKQFIANLNTLDGPKDLTGYQTVSFRVQGSLPKVGMALENGNERWRSNKIPVQGKEQLIKMDLDQLEYQTRADVNSPWKKADYRPPGTVKDISFKTGWFFNDSGASGDVTLSDLRFE